MENLFQKITDLMNKQGGHWVLTDIASSQTYVMVRLEEYESLSNKSVDIDSLNEEQLLDKINKDISAWKMSRKNNS
ncbi:MAG: hypothetical protein HY602_03310 [Parcubacteria group bacterium]|nr:hypothetical protein [Parcubacteria group bacterium]